MLFDRWDDEQFDEWEPCVYENIAATEEDARQQEMPQDLGQAKGYPEVEIGSCSDDEAPPPPESIQLARANLELRNRVVALAENAKVLEMRNKTLKSQLMSARDNFKKQQKSLFRNLFGK
jgi:hypothetical protein